MGGVGVGEGGLGAGERARLPASAQPRPTAPPPFPPQAVMFHYLDVTGHSTGWNWAFYIVTFFRGLLTITVLFLIGAGWSLIKPFLNDREKRFLLIALPIQVLNNVAIVVTDEMAPGSTRYSAW